MTEVKGVSSILEWRKDLLGPPYVKPNTKAEASAVGATERAKVLSDVSGQNYRATEGAGVSYTVYVVTGLVLAYLINKNLS